MKEVDKRYLKALGIRIRELREKEGMSQKQLGFECEMHRTNINRIEKGWAEAGATTLRQIAAAFGMTPSQLVDFPFDEDSPNAVVSQVKETQGKRERKVRRSA